MTDDETAVLETAHYNQCLTQDGIDRYNRIIGGFTDQSGEKVKGINEKINLYNQQRQEGSKLKPFSRLFKQILSKNSRKERFSEITDNNSVFPTLKNFIALNDDKLKEAVELMRSFFGHGEQYDLEKIYIKGSALNTISQKWFTNWAAVRGLLRTDRKRNSGRVGENGEAVKLPEFISIAQLKRALESRSIVGTDSFIEAKDLFRDTYRHLYREASSHFEAFVRIWQREWQDCIEKDEASEKGYNAARQDVVEMMQRDKQYKRDDAKQVASIKAYCDSALAVFQMMKYFALEKGRKKVMPDTGIDAEFYNAFDDYYQDYPVPAYYDEFRNYLTRKAHLGRLLFPSFGGKLEQRYPSSKRATDGAEKIKLNFENGMLLEGWDKNKESQYYGVLFKDGRKFLLGIMTKEHHNLFTDENKFVEKSSTGNFMKIQYRQLNNLFRQLPHIAFASKNNEKYKVTRELVEARAAFKKFQSEKRENKTLSFDKRKIGALIDLYKMVLAIDYKDFSYEGVLEREYESLNDFFSAVEHETYSLKFVPAEKSYVENAVAAGKLLLFEIHNKDWNLKDGKEKAGSKNLHTLYFNALFDAKNLGDPVLKLSGGAEVFFRPQNRNLGKKKDARGRVVTDHKRYGEDKTFLHVPIVLNMGAGRPSKFNSQVNQLIADDKKEQRVKIIGIDRGEKNLAYFSLIDQNGKLLDCGHLNGELPKEETYLKKLEELAKERDKARKDWRTIESIKERKNGYIAWAAHKLADIMIRENAILIFEDLSVGFKRERQKIEQQVYQKLELALVRKLNYFVQKGAPEGTAGHHLKAFQLTPEVSTPQDIGKQCGAVFYVSPGYTSLTCPDCGYRKNISFEFENISKARDFMKKINLSMKYRNGSFDISYRLPDEKGIVASGYKVSSNVERIRWHRNGTEYAKKDTNRPGEQVIESAKSGVVKKYEMTATLCSLFDENEIMYQSIDLSALELSAPESANYYRRLFWFLNLLLHSRNSVSGTDIDYIQCPRCLFHSKNGFRKFSWNGDANGAYNIARKGLIALRKIQDAEDPFSIKWGDLKIGVEEWDAFVQSTWNPASKSQK